MDAAHTERLAAVRAKMGLPDAATRSAAFLLADHESAGLRRERFLRAGSGRVVGLFRAYLAAVRRTVGAAFRGTPGMCACCILAAAPVIALRLLLLPNHPVPTPDIYDEFGHLLVADTLRHFRLANPPHALPQFFETFFVLQRPTYSSIYPIGQGLVLAIGWTLFGTPWAGVILATAAFCALCYWMLRGWVSPSMGAGRRGARGYGVRPAVPMDEQLLGRRRDGLRGMPGIRRAAAIESAAHASATRRCSVWASRSTC